MRPKRIWVTGNAGSGKTTIAARIADHLSYPHHELDAVHWLPDWGIPPRDEFRAKVEGLAASERWVIDGNYSKARDLLLARADTVIYLNPTRALALWRVLVRSLSRALKREELWAGNRETLGHFFSRESLLLYALRSHPKRRQQFAGESQDPSYGHITFVELGTNRQINDWIAAL